MAEPSGNCVNKGETEKLSISPIVGRVNAVSCRNSGIKKASSKTLVFTFSNLTEINSQKAKCESADHTLRFLVDGLGEAVVFADSDSNIVGWNSGAAKMFGFDTSQVSEIRFSDVIPGVSTRKFRGRILVAEENAISVLYSVLV